MPRTTPPTPAHHPPQHPLNAEHPSSSTTSNHHQGHPFGPQTPVPAPARPTAGLAPGRYNSLLHTKPTAAHNPFSQIKASDLILVDHDGNLLHGKRPVNRAAFVIHSEVHKARPDALAAAHSHSLHGKAFSSLGIPLDPITQDACAFFEDHGIHSDYQGVVSDAEEGKRIGAALASYKAVILQNHGLLTVGQSVAEAVWWFITMERSCQAQLLAMAAGTPRLIDRDTALHTRSQVGGHFAGWFQAQPLWDQITASDPDLFD